MAVPAKTLEPLRADPGRAAILCDIDGTLAPIVDDPERAAVPPQASAVLARLALRYGTVACVTGRRASVARSMVGLDSITYAGNHGLELLSPGDPEPRLDPGLGHRGGAARGFASRLDWRHLGSVGLHLEDKGPIQAVHWRTAADAEVAAQRAEEIAALAREEGLTPHFGRMVLELRPLATVHKGVAARRIVTEAGAATAMFGGDDRTDLDAFEALRELRASGALDAGICIGVVSQEAPPEITHAADAVVGGPAEFLDLLRSLL